MILANLDQFSQTEKSVFAAEMGKNMKIRDFEDFHRRFWFKMAVFWAPSRHIQGKKKDPIFVISIFERICPLGAKKGWSEISKCWYMSHPFSLKSLFWTSICPYWPKFKNQFFSWNVWFTIEGMCRKKFQNHQGDTHPWFSMILDD